MSITVFSKPACVQCDATKKALDKLHIPYTAVDMTEDFEALERARSLGYLQAPVVFIDDDNHWSGYRPDQIKALAQSFISA